MQNLRVIDPEMPKIQFKARSDEYLRTFFEDQFLMCKPEHKYQKIDQFENTVYQLFYKITQGKCQTKSYESATPYERLIKFNRTIINFRTGTKIIQLTISEDCIKQLSIIGRVLNTAASNIFRLCIFETIDFTKYENDSNTSKIIASILTDYQIICEQINTILKDLKEMEIEENMENIKIENINKVNDSTSNT